MATAQVPSRHKALVYDEPGKISTKIEEVDTPKPGVGEVLVHLTHSGVCHSDMGIMTNSWAWLPAPTAKGQVGGHEGVGEVVAFGAGTESSGLKKGDRVGIKWLAAVCGNCPPCLAGIDASCVNGKISGYYTPGTFQQVCTPNRIDDGQWLKLNSTPLLRPHMSHRSQMAYPPTLRPPCCVAA